MSANEHESMIKTPKQLIVVMVLAFVVPVVAMIMLAQLVIGGAKSDSTTPEFSDEAVRARIKPVAEVNVQFGAAAAAGARAGEDIFKGVCSACHATGAAGAPKFGDKAAWGPRLKDGVAAVYAIGMKGKGAMPPRGGDSSLSDAEFKSAVDYMVNAVK